MTQTVTKTLKTKGSVKDGSACYKMFATVIETLNGQEITVMSQSRDELTQFLSRNKCGHFDADRFQEVVVFSAKSFIEADEE